jgi:hypothetical protein
MKVGGENTAGEAMRLRRPVTCAIAPRLEIIHEETEGFGGLASKHVPTERSYEAYICASRAVDGIEFSVFLYVLRYMWLIAARTCALLLSIFAYIVNGRKRRTRMRRTGGYRGKLLAAAKLAERPRSERIRHQRTRYAYAILSLLLFLVFGVVLCKAT